MSALALDTHALVKELTGVGLSEPQAEAITSVVGRAREFDLKELATKGDIALLRSEMATKTDLAEFKAEMTRWMFGQTIVTLGAVAAILKLLH